MVEKSVVKPVLPWHDFQKMRFVPPLLAGRTSMSSVFVVRCHLRPISSHPLLSALTDHNADGALSESFDEELDMLGGGFLRPLFRQMGVDNMTDFERLAGLCILWEYRELVDHAFGWTGLGGNRRLLHEWLSRRRKQAINLCAGANGIIRETNFRRAMKEYAKILAADVPLLTIPLELGTPLPFIMWKFRKPTKFIITVPKSVYS